MHLQICRVKAAVSTAKFHDCGIHENECADWQPSSQQHDCIYTQMYVFIPIQLSLTEVSRMWWWWSATLLRLQLYNVITSLNTSRHFCLSFRFVTTLCFSVKDMLQLCQSSTFSSFQDGMHTPTKPLAVLTVNWLTDRSDCVVGMHRLTRYTCKAIGRQAATVWPKSYSRYRMSSANCEQVLSD